MASLIACTWRTFVPVQMRNRSVKALPAPRSRTIRSSAFLSSAAFTALRTSAGRVEPAERGRDLRSARCDVEAMRLDVLLDGWRHPAVNGLARRTALAD